MKGEKITSRGIYTHLREIYVRYMYGCIPKFTGHTIFFGYSIWWRLVTRFVVLSPTYEQFLLGVHIQEAGPSQGPFGSSALNSAFEI